MSPFLPDEGCMSYKNIFSIFLRFYACKFETVFEENIIFCYQPTCSGHFYICNNLNICVTVHFEGCCSLPEPVSNLERLAVVEPLDVHGRVWVRFQAALNVGALPLP